MVCTVLCVRFRVRDTVEVALTLNVLGNYNEIRDAFWTECERSQDDYDAVYEQDDNIASNAKRPAQVTLKLEIYEDFRSS